MKNIILYICSLAVLFGVVSCDKLPVTDPLNEPGFFFKFKQKTGEQNDFFTINNTYIPDSVKIKYDNYTYYKKFYYRLFNNAYIFGFGDYRDANLYYIDYQNGDIDTLSKVVVSQHQSPTIKGIDKLTWYFNGKMLKEFDFKNNEGLREELYNKNCFGCYDTAIIIDILK